MSINWFPGHMHKARKEIAKTMDEVDVVIEVLDARLPQSSENPLVDSLRKGKPVIKLLNKADLADPALTEEWLAFFNAMDAVQALALDYQNKKLIKRLPELCRQLVPSRANAGRPVRAMIMGIPNVGKSTLINALLGKRIAKVGNQPAVTRSQQRFSLQGGMALSDTPGILWPKIEDPDSGYRLAASGAIRDTAIEFEDVALFAAGFLLRQYPDRIQERYRLAEVPAIAEELIDAIGRKRGCLRPGGVVDRHKASEILLNEMRSGKLGRISFETVAEWDEKRRQAALEEAERLAAEDEQQQDSK
ncbi:ribosome biogenesis GTPase A [Marinobacterium nitratireducens]|uniref:Ribosome biogenesis GTPase A n=1 Tax=Marinobacterium nitratireducens TaxID=518897 RepID=A0A917Z837_9GAMM|nr:ribosome biogenesis GTPase YlqF [Marinobacterium nitratireducens]GGO77040.1 ribosome biogenesis GTPase A [Marinobacterium nitratireducens]